MIVAALYILVVFVLGIYSYSQIDLNLTLFSSPIFLTFQKSMIGLGYYNRSLSTEIFVAIILSLTLLYIFLLRQANKISLKVVLLLLGSTAIISLNSYPAFSYDIFNYMFDARIVTKYHANPYLFKGLDFPSDTWLRFMRWVHRTYPYAPFWLVLTIPFSFLGFGKFVPTLILFKLLFIGSYLGAVYLIAKISEQHFPQHKIRNVIFFAFNPLVVVEFLISPHLDGVMATLLLLSLYFLSTKAKSWSAVALILSAGVKFLTILILPLLFLKISFQKLINWSILISLISLIPVIYLREAYPWYFLVPFTLIALSDNQAVRQAAIVFSIGILFQYAPFIFIGSYPPEVTMAKNILLGATLAISTGIFILFRTEKIKKQT